MTACLLLGILRFSFNLGFEPTKATVNFCEVQAKVFTELIDALAHDDILIFAIFDWFPRRKPCAGVSHDGAETSPNEDLFLGCYLLADGISAAARKKWRLRYITILWAAPRRSAHGEPCEEAQEGLAKDSLHGSLPRPVVGGSGFLLRDG